MQAPREPQRGPQGACRARASETLGPQTRAGIAPCLERGRPGRAHEGRRQRHEQHPPALVRERAHALSPADGREPRQASAADVACGPHDEREPEQRPRGSARGPAAAPNAIDPATGSPSPASPSHVSATTPRLASATTRSAAASPACLPTTVAPSSSDLPLSSSARVWRTARSRLISAARTAAPPVKRHAVMPPMLARSKAGPYSARKDVFTATVAANAVRSRAVGNSS